MEASCQCDDANSKNRLKFTDTLVLLIRGANAFRLGAKRSANQQRRVFQKLGASTDAISNRVMPEKIANATTPLWLLTIGFSANSKKLVFNGKYDDPRPAEPSPMRRSGARHQTLCAIDQAHCEVQKAQSRVMHPAAGDLRRADHGAFAAGKMAAPRRSASGRLPHATWLRRNARRHRAVDGAIAIGIRSLAALVAAFGTIADRRSGAAAFEDFGRLFAEARGVFA